LLHTPKKFPKVPFDSIFVAEYFVLGNPNKRYVQIASQIDLDYLLRKPEEYILAPQKLKFFFVSAESVR
ncbi:MAG: hypothetical protein AAB356_01315, partial [Deltaproteobacteria bacterium]